MKAWDLLETDAHNADRLKPNRLKAWRANPFFVLEVATDASPADVERAGQRLLALLAVGSESAGRYQTPLGPATRDADVVRQGLAALRDSEQRVLHELWANVAPVTADGPRDNSAEPWDAAARAIGWTGSWTGIWADR
jgi:hypothetical protein